MLATQIKIHLLDVLLDGVHLFLSCDFHLGISPAGHFNDHVVDLVLGISVRGNVMERTFFNLDIWPKAEKSYLMICPSAFL